MPADLLTCDPESPEAGGLAARVAADPGFWAEWLSELSRTGLLEALLADEAVSRALREAPAGHQCDRVLNAKMTLVCVLVACLFPGGSYDKVLALAFGLPGPRFRPPWEKVPTGSAFSQARKLLGEQVLRRVFEIDAETSDADLGVAVPWKGLEVTAIDGTTMELQREACLAGEFGSSSDRGRPLLRVTAHVRTVSRRWIAAAAGSYRQGENELADQLEDSFGKGIPNITDRGSSPCTGSFGSARKAPTSHGGSRTPRSRSPAGPSATTARTPHEPLSPHPKRRRPGSTNRPARQRQHALTERSNRDSDLTS